MGKYKRRSWPELPEPLAGPITGNYTYLPVHEGETPGTDRLELSLDEQSFRAKATGIVRVISSAYEILSSDPTIQIVCAYEGARVAATIHPNEAASHTGVTELSPDGLVPRQVVHHVSLDEAIARTERLLKDPLVVTVGKSGLGHLRTAVQGRETQKRFFIAHLELDAGVDLPVQIHSRDAYADILEALADIARVNQPIVFHCFPGDAHLARALAEKGRYAPSASSLTYSVNENLRTAPVAMPRELVLAEAGAPYLIPAPHRGFLNTSYVVAYTVRFIAELWGVGEEEACVQLTENTRHVYGI